MARKTLTLTDWSDLPQELVISIANRIVLIEDFTAFGAVCKSWRSAATKEIFNSRLTHHVPFLMFRKEDAVGMLEFYSLTRDKILKFKLPEGGVQISCSCLGWLFTSRRGLEELNLLHPLNHSQIKLPGFRDSSCQVLRCREELLPLSDLSYHQALLGHQIIQSLVSMTHKNWHFANQENINIGQGRFYAMNNDGIWVCDTENPKQAKANVVVPEIPWDLWPVVRNSFMAESAGDLLLVIFYYKGGDRSNPRFRVFKVPLRDGYWHSDLEVKDLGNRTLFVGNHSGSITVVTSDYGCKPNCIYFSFLYADYGIYNMKDGTIQKHFGSRTLALRESPMSWLPHLWIQPSF
ncbi:hypothetical protein ACE6H2_028005 [Prunus campanulata]